MAERSLLTLMAAGLRVKAPVSPTTFGGPARELSGVGLGISGPHEPFAGAWQRNISGEGRGTLLTYSPIYACTTRIAGDIAKLGIDLKVESDNGISVKAPKTSPYWMTLRRPNGYQNRIQFIRYWMLCKLIFGNAYAVKFRDARGIVTSLYLLDPRLVTPMVTPDGGVYYSIGGDQLARVPTGYAAAPASEIIHDRGPTLWHPLVGVPPLYAAAMSGTLGLQIQRNSVAFFGNMSRPSGVLKAPGEIQPETAERMKREWNENYGKGGLGKTALLTNGLEYSAMAVAAEQSQLAEQLGLTAIDVATAYSMPAYKINQGQMPTSNNVSALNLQYYGDCLQTQIEDIELCLDEGLGVPDGYSVQFDIDGLVRMDPMTLYEALGKAIGAGLMAPNEGRARLNLGPKAGGDALYLQQQNFSTEALAKRDALDDPFGKATAPAPAPAPSPEPAPPAELDDDSKALLQRSAAAIEAAAARVAEQEAAAVAARQADAEALALRAAEQQTAEAERATKAAEAFAEQMRALAAATETINAAAAKACADIEARAAAVPAPALPAVPPDAELDAFAALVIRGLELEHA